MLKDLSYSLNALFDKFVDAENRLNVPFQAKRNANNPNKRIVQKH